MTRLRRARVALSLCLIVAAYCSLVGGMRPFASTAYAAANDAVSYAVAHWNWNRYDGSQGLAPEGYGQNGFQCAEFVARSLVAAGHIGPLGTTSIPADYGSLRYGGQVYNLLGVTTYVINGVNVPGLYQFLINSGLGTDIGTSPAGANIGSVIFYGNPIEHVALLTDSVHQRVTQHNVAELSSRVDNDWNPYPTNQVPITHVVQIDYNGLAAGKYAGGSVPTKSGVTMTTPAPYYGKALTSATTTFSWKPVAGAIAYEVGVYDVFGNLMFGESTTAKSFTFTAPKYGQYAYFITPVSPVAQFLTFYDTFAYESSACLTSSNSYRCEGGSGGVAPQPAVSSFSPGSGPAAGGTSVTIAGAAFVGATTVQFGSTPATSVTVNSDTQLTAVSPPGTAGTVDVTVATPGGTSATSSADRFTWRNPGGVFITGHDPDYHAGADYSGSTGQVGAEHLIQRAISYVSSGNLNPKILLVTDLRNPGGDESDPRLGLSVAGYSFDVADYGSGTPGVFDLHTVNFSNYDVVVVSSDYGGWLRQDELDILNARTSDIAAFVDDGGGVVAFAEGGDRQVTDPSVYAGTTGNRYAFLPFPVAPYSENINENGSSITTFGADIGLTNADVNSNAAHSAFASPGGLNVVDYGPYGEVLSLAERGQQL